MANTLVLVGPYEALNFVAGSTDMTATEEDAKFPLTQVADGEPGSLYRGLTKANDLHIVANMNRILNSVFAQFPDPTKPDHWEDLSSGTGALSRETTIVFSGLNSLKLTSGGAGNEARSRQRRPFIAGQPVNVDVALHGDGSVESQLFVQNVKSGRYLLPDGTWTGTRTKFAGNSVAEWQSFSAAAVIEDVDACQSGYADLSFDLELSGSGVGYVGRVRCWPHWNFSAVFGHSLEDSLQVITQGDGDPGFASPINYIVHGIPRRRAAFYGYIPGDVFSTEILARLSTSGARSDTISVGEWVVGRYYALPRGIRLPRTERPDIGLSRGLGVVSTSSEPAMTAPIQVRITRSQWLDFKLRVLSASRYGGNRSVLVPNTDEPDVYLGHLVAEEIGHSAGDAVDVALTMYEEPFSVEPMP